MTSNRSRVLSVALSICCVSALFLAASASADGIVYVKNQSMGVGDFAAVNPSSKVHVKADGNAQVLVEDVAASTAVRAQFEARNNGANLFRFRNTATGNVWFFGGGSSDSLIIEKNAGSGGKLQLFANGTMRVGPKPSVVFDLTPSGALTIGGTLTQNSSRSTKFRFDDVDVDQVLEAVDSLPLTVWTYRDDSTGARHVGPMAEDFNAAFGLGADDKHLAPADTAGVALAAIQGLNRRLEEKDQRIRELEGQLDSFASELEEIRSLLKNDR